MSWVDLWLKGVMCLLLLLILWALTWHAAIHFARFEIEAKAYYLEEQVYIKVLPKVLKSAGLAL